MSEPAPENSDPQTGAPAASESEAGWFQQAMMDALNWFWELIDPWTFGLIRNVLGYLMELPNLLLLKLANWTVDHAESFMQWLLDSGIIPPVAIGSIPAEYAVFLGYLRLDQAAGILMSAYAIKFTRKRLFR